MLHMILGILKIIGIILGILLLLLLAVILSALFVPVRYRVQAKKQEGQMTAAVTLSWLLHLISIAFRVDSQAHFRLTVRLLGIRLPLPRKKKRRNHSSRRRKADDAESRKEAPEGLLPEGPAEDLPPDSIQNDETERDENNVPDEDWICARGGGPYEFQKSGKIAKIRFYFRKICDKIKLFYEKIKVLLRALSSLPNVLKRTARKVGELWRRPQELWTLAQELELREVFGNVFGYLKYLLKHYAPRRIRGTLTFGTGDPAMTAKLTGVIYMLLPARADCFTMTPEFDTVCFETDITLCGRIRACHALFIVWRAFRDKKLRRMIKYRKKTA